MREKEKKERAKEKEDEKRIERQIMADCLKVNSSLFFSHEQSSVAIRNHDKTTDKRRILWRGKACTSKGTCHGVGNASLQKKKYASLNTNGACNALRGYKEVVQQEGSHIVSKFRVLIIVPFK